MSRRVHPSYFAAPVPGHVVLQAVVTSGGAAAKFLGVNLDIFVYAPDFFVGTGWRLPDAVAHTALLAGFLFCAHVRFQFPWFRFEGVCVKSSRQIY
jgi:hypothetical protein